MVPSKPRGDCAGVHGPAAHVDKAGGLHGREGADCGALPYTDTARGPAVLPTGKEWKRRPCSGKFVWALLESRGDMGLDIHFLGNTANTALVCF